MTRKSKSKMPTKQFVRRDKKLKSGYSYFVPPAVPAIILEASGLTDRTFLQYRASKGKIIIEATSDVAPQTIL